MVVLITEPAVGRGNVGAVVFGFCFQRLDGRKALLTMGCLIIASSTLSAFVFVKGQSSLIFGNRGLLEKTAQSYGENTTSDEESIASRRKTLFIGRGVFSI